jgi:hypothetical protein
MEKCRVTERKKERKKERMIKTKEKDRRKEREVGMAARRIGFKMGPSINRAHCT